MKKRKFAELTLPEKQEMYDKIQAISDEYVEPAIIQPMIHTLAATLNVTHHTLFRIFLELYKSNHPRPLYDPEDFKFSKEEIASWNFDDYSKDIDYGGPA